MDPTEEAPTVKHNKLKYRPLSSLRCYQVACQAGWQNLPVEEVTRRVHDLKMAAFENLGAGFYSYENAEKVRYYNQARAALGSIVALLCSCKARRDQWNHEISVIESQVIPACSALIRKIEKKIT